MGIQSLPVEILLQVLSECNAPKLLALRNTSWYLRDTVDNNLDLLIPEIIYRYYEEEDHLLTGIISQADATNTDVILQTAVAVIMELDLLDDGELDIGIMQRCLLSPSQRLCLPDDSLTKFSSVPGFLLPIEPGGSAGPSSMKTL